MGAVKRVGGDGTTPHLQQTPHHVAFVLITTVRLDVKINKIISSGIMPHDSCLLGSRVDES